jgi:hypothetical protein
MVVVLENILVDEKVVLLVYLWADRMALLQVEKKGKTKADKLVSLLAY